MPAAPAPSPLEEHRRLRWLLPGSLVDGEPAGRTRRDHAVDAAMYLCAVLLGTLVLAETWSDRGALARGLDLGLGTVALVALHWRRSHPTQVAVLTGAISFGFGFAAGAAALAGFNAAIRSPARGIWLVALVSLVACAVYPALYPSTEGYAFEVAFGVLFTAIVIGWGLFVRARRELVRSLRQRAERAETDARDAERRRIAREMHDVLAHRISLLSVHAGALEFRPDAPAEEIAEAAGVIRRSARAALEELRDVIGVLREEPTGDDPEPPQPTLADLPALVAESRAAGMRVALDFAAPADDPAPAATGRTAYRIVQEGLTNVRKHAPGAAVDVSVSGTGDGLVVQVRSRAPVGATAGGGRGVRVLPGAGTGLIGLAERVSLAGGELEHGVDAIDGAFVLRARLPR